LPEIGIQHRIDVVVEHRIIPQKPCDRAIAVAGLRFGSVHSIVDAELATREQAELLANALEGSGSVDLVDQAGTGDRAGIDHGIERFVVVGEPDRVEGLAARLDADGGSNPLFPDQIQCERKDERLRDRLNGELDGTVAGLIDMAVDGDETYAEMSRIGL